MTHVLGERLKELAEDADQEKMLKDIAKATTKEKGKEAEAAEKKAQSSEKARLLAEEKLVETEDRLGGIELKLAKSTSLNLAQALKPTKKNGITKASRMPRNLQSLLSIRHRFMGLRRDSWQPSR